MSEKLNSLLEKTYIQKSRLFLLPLTGLKRHAHFRETDTYISAPELIATQYPEGITFDDKILIVVYSKLYKIKHDNIFNQINSNFKNIDAGDETGWDIYENSVVSNRYIIAFHETQDEFIYTFDLSDWTKDWHLFLKGRYSQMSKKAKDLVKNYRWNSLKPIEQRKLYCYLYPSETFPDEKKTCFEKFSEDLGYPVAELEKVKELCSKPNLKLETFKITKKELNETKS